MGSTSSKSSASNVNNNKAAKEAIVQKRVQQINHMRQEYQQESRQQDVATAACSDALVSSMISATTQIDTFQVAETQMLRKDKPLTKADLIAIIVALEPMYNNKLSELMLLTAPNLILIIRSIIYNPDRYKCITAVEPSAPFATATLIEDSDIK